MTSKSTKRRTEWIELPNNMYLVFSVVSWDGGGSWNGVCRVEQSSSHLEEKIYTLSRVFPRK